ncbi:hypothetical protein KNJ79_10320 [Sphingopyxis indica]|uniref:hypothetical protein n=1 Tax=Sphingopyxis indica TaxID=436663 RepID=UPI002938CF9F|nr:hypothetical protein [Sphingopyxis indica]WOF41663.1 hypothetical protein KNJ79_10320 [Sphingopyxis indica]
MTRLILPAALLLTLAACGGSDSTNKTTTKLDAVEVEPGTISDSMIVLDDTNIDGTAVDDSVPAGDTAKPAGKKADDEAAAATEESEEKADPDAVPAPKVKQSVTPDAASKTGAD